MTTNDILAALRAIAAKVAKWAARKAGALAMTMMMIVVHLRILAAVTAGS